MNVNIFCYFDGGQWPFNDMLEQEKSLKGTRPSLLILKPLNVFVEIENSYCIMKFHPFSKKLNEYLNISDGKVTPFVPPRWCHST